MTPVCATAACAVQPGPQTAWCTAAGVLSAEACCVVHGCNTMCQLQLAIRCSCQATSSLTPLAYCRGTEAQPLSQDLLFCSQQPTPYLTNPVNVPQPAFRLAAWLSSTAQWHPKQHNMQQHLVAPPTFNKVLSHQHCPQVLFPLYFQLCSFLFGSLHVQKDSTQKVLIMVLTTPCSD